MRKLLSFSAVVKYCSHSVTAVRRSIPAAGIDPVALIKKLTCEVTNPGDSLLLHLSSQILCVSFNHPIYRFHKISKNKM